MHILMVDYTPDYEVADLHGPFDTVVQAQAYAERLRAKLGLPIEATPENNEAWTEAGWYFGIFEPRIEDFDPPRPDPVRWQQPPLPEDPEQAAWARDARP